VRQNELRKITIHEKTYTDSHPARRVRRWWQHKTQDASVG